MSTAPIINVSSAANSSASVSKAGNSANSSDQSFGQVLSQEVDSRNNASAARSSNANSNSASTTSTSASASVAGSKTAKSKSSDNSSQTSGSSSTTSASTDAGTASASAQLLALVSNVQQTGSSSNSAAPAASNAIASTAPIGGAVGLDTQAQAALAKAQEAAVSSATSTSSTAAGTPSSDVSQQGVAAELKNIKLADPSTASISNSTDTGANAGASTDTSNIAPQTEKLSAATPQVATGAGTMLDLAATAEKNIKSGLAALDTNAVKIEQAVQTTPTTVATASTQQAMLNAQALPANPGDSLTPSVGSASWDQALGQKVVWMVAGGQQNASLTLNPPDLGPMQVVLNVTNSHATVAFSASQPEVRQALETALPKLREMLGDAGIQLGQASINSGSAQQQNAPSQQSSSNSIQSTANTGETAISATVTVKTSAGLGLVDTFA